MREGRLLPLVNEIQRFHPDLWAKIRFSTILAGLPHINEYCGTDFTGNDDAYKCTEVLLEKLKERRASGEPPRTSVIVGGR